MPLKKRCNILDNKNNKSFDEIDFKKFLNETEDEVNKLKYNKKTNNNFIVNYNTLNKFFIKSNENIVNTCNYTKMLVYKIDEIENLMDKLEKDIDKLNNKEAQRIIKECIYNNYEKEYNTDIKTVFSIIGGSEKIGSFMKSFISQKIEYKKSLQKSRGISNASIY